jgi:hypothetical protein
MLLQVSNNLDQLQSTLVSYLSANGTASMGSVPVKNTNGFQANWAVQFGKTGEETAEILTQSVSGTQLVFANSGTTRFAHPLDTPIYQIHYDSVIFLRSTTGTTGVASALATVSITPDSFYTEYNDSSGAATYAYQSQYYNSVTGDISGTSLWFVPGGPTFYSKQKLVARAKHDLYSSSFIKDDDTITDWVNEWLEIMTNSMIKVNQGYAIGTASYAFTVTNEQGLATITDSLFKNPVKIEVTYDGTNYVNSTEIPINEFSSTDRFSSINPRHYWQGDVTLGILPANTGGTVRMTNSIRYSPLVNDTDELPQIMKGYTTSFVEYCLYKAYSLDQKDEPADSHYQKAVLYQNAFVAEITPRDQTGVKMIDFVESLSGGDDLSVIY